MGLVTAETDKKTGKKTYAYDPHIDPSLQWAGKAEHTSFEVPTQSLHVHERIDPRSIYNGVVRKYRPDFIIRLSTSGYLVLETKGQDTARDKTKRAFLNEWVEAVNSHGGFGRWKWAVSKNPADLEKIIVDNAVPSSI